MPEKSILDARLAEIDRRLRTIQSGLEPVAQAARVQRAPDVPPAPPDVPIAPPDAAPAPVIPPDAAPVPKRLTADAGAVADLVARLTALAEAHERLIAAAREERRQPADAAAPLTMSAGPFAGTDALRRFERALQMLPGVRSVAVREYEGADRAILDVHLLEPTP